MYSPIERPVRHAVPGPPSDHDQPLKNKANARSNIQVENTVQVEITRV